MNLINLKELLSAIPEEERKGLTLETFQDKHLKTIVKDRISDYFQSVAKEQNKLTRFKRSVGFCSVPNCLNVSGPYTTCWQCEQAKRNRQRNNRCSEYGQIRREEKKNGR